MNIESESLRVEAGIDDLPEPIYEFFGLDEDLPQVAVEVPPVFSARTTQRLPRTP